jgi:hypothetical protein
MKIFDDTHNSLLQPLLTKGMGSEKWHLMLRAAGQHLAGQGNIPGFLNRTDSFKIKTLTKETLGEVTAQSWRGLHQDSQQNCYTYLYLTKPWISTCDPCHTASRVEPFCAWLLCWMPCWVSLCPLTLTSSLLGGLTGMSRDIYNFSKNGLAQPLDDNNGISLGLFSKKSVQKPERQVMQDEDSPALNL